MIRSAAPRFSPERQHLGWLFMLGTLVLAVAVGAGIAVPELFFRSYLLACWFYLSLSLGAVMWLAIQRLTGGRWIALAGPHWRVQAAALPWLALAFLPLLAGHDALFPWAGSERGQLHFEGHQGQWLQTPWHSLRTVAYLAIWCGVALAVRYRSGRAPAALGLVLLIPVTTLFAVDWLLALTLQANTSMIGFISISGQAAGAMALAVLGAAVQSRRDPVPAEQWRDAGNLLLGAVLFFGYCLFMDYLIVWQANLPHEAAWYQLRAQVFSPLVIALLVLCALVLPFFLLLSHRVKTSAVGMVWVAAVVLVGRLLQAYWDTAPTLEDVATPLVALIMDGLLLVALGLYYAGLLLWMRRLERDKHQREAERNDA